MRAPLRHGTLPFGTKKWKTAKSDSTARTCPGQLRDTEAGLDRLNRGSTYAGEALQGRGFVGKFGKDLIKLGDFKNFFNFWSEPDDLHGATFFDNAKVVAHQFTNAGTVQIFQSGQVQNDIVVALLQEGLNHLLKSTRFERCKATANLHDRNIFRLANIN